MYVSDHLNLQVQVLPTSAVPSLSCNEPGPLASHQPWIQVQATRRFLPRLRLQTLYAELLHGL